MILSACSTTVVLHDAAPATPPLPRGTSLLLGSSGRSSHSSASSSSIQIHVSGEYTESHEEGGSVGTFAEIIVGSTVTPGGTVDVGNPVGVGILVGVGVGVGVGVAVGHLNVPS